jgi:hypothetical protein
LKTIFFPVRSVYATTSWQDVTPPRMTAVFGGFNRWMQHTRDCASSGVLQMKQRRRIYYTETQKALMWERWQNGESLQHIAQLFDRNHSSIQRILAESGGKVGLRTQSWPFSLMEARCAKSRAYDHPMPRDRLFGHHGATWSSAQTTDGASWSG